MLIRSKKFKQKTITVGKSKNKGYPSKYVEKCGENLADVYRFYNGGYWFFYESERGGTVCDNKEMRKYCVRGGTFTDKAKTKWLSFCDVNYSYPEKVYKYSQKYKTGPDGIRFWYALPVEVPKEVPKEEIKEQPKEPDVKKRVTKRETYNK